MRYILMLLLTACGGGGGVVEETNPEPTIAAVPRVVEVCVSPFGEDKWVCTALEK